MPTWGQQLDVIKKEIAAAQARGQSAISIDLDKLRRDALAALSAHTGRATVAYITRWTQGHGRADEMAVSIGDLHAFMEVLHGLPGPALDLILHTAGGSPTAAEAIVDYVRTKFDDVRIIVPMAAMSAGTLMACAGNRILMGKHSYLGPTDPQLVLQTPLGVQSVPAYAILEQFRLAQADAGDPKLYPAWVPMLQQYGPGLIVHCRRAVELSHVLAERWLAKYMFGQHGGAIATAAATRAAKALADTDEHKVHGRFLSRDKVRAIGLLVDDLETDQELQDLALTAFHAFAHTFNFNPNAQKIVENNIGRCWLRATPSGLQTPQLPAPTKTPLTPPVPSGAPPAKTPTPTPAAKTPAKKKAPAGKKAPAKKKTAAKTPGKRGG